MQPSCEQKFLAILASILPLALAQSSTPAPTMPVQSSVVTVASSTIGPTIPPTSVFTTSIYFIAGDVAGDFLPYNYGIKSDLTLRGSVVTVNPTGTVMDLDCPYTSLATFPGVSNVCTGLTSMIYTVRPSTEYFEFDFTSCDYYGFNTSVVFAYNGSCVNYKTYSSMSACEIEATTDGSELGFRTDYTIASVTPVPVELAAGLEKLGPIPESIASRTRSTRLALLLPELTIAAMIIICL